MASRLIFATTTCEVLGLQIRSDCEGPEVVVYPKGQSIGSSGPGLATGTTGAVLVLAKHVEGSRMGFLRMVGS